MYLEHFWLSIIGVFLCGMLSMLGILIWADARKRAKRPRQAIGTGNSRYRNRG